MTYKEKIDAETNNVNKINLYKEGIFWIAYEKSAFAFTTQIKEYTPNKKLIKSIGQEVISIGFPDSVLKQYTQERTVEEQADTKVTLIVDNIEDDAFQKWKQAIEQKTKVINVTPQTYNKGDQANITQQIRNFNIESKTPMECMMFLIELKKQL